MHNLQQDSASAYKAHVSAPLLNNASGVNFCVQRARSPIQTSPDFFSLGNNKIHNLQRQSPQSP
jgi:hypothetical protein